MQDQKSLSLMASYACSFKSYSQGLMPQTVKDKPKQISPEMHVHSGGIKKNKPSFSSSIPDLQTYNTLVNQLHTQFFDRQFFLVHDKQVLYEVRYEFVSLCGVDAGARFLCLSECCLTASRHLTSHNAVIHGGFLQTTNQNRSAVKTFLMHLPLLWDINEYLHWYHISFVEPC